MKAARKFILRIIVVYYLKAAVFVVGSYGLLLLVYGHTKISFFEWTLILLAAFTVGYIPTLLQLLHQAKGDERNDWN